MRGMVITLITVAVGGFGLLAALEGKGYLCDSCRYLSKRTKNTKSKFGTCKIHGCPACYTECKYYEHWGERK